MYFLDHMKNSCGVYVITCVSLYLYCHHEEGTVLTRKSDHFKKESDHFKKESD